MQKASPGKNTRRRLFLKSLWELHFIAAPVTALKVEMKQEKRDRQ
jgi:hypothetical protein